MSLDRDLRDALQPLLGDPVADAARVLGALGPSPRPGPFGLPKGTLGLTLAALACGVLLGVVAGRLFAGPATQPPRASPPDKTEPGKTEPGKTEPAQDWRSMAQQFGEELDFTAFGPVAIDEPGVGAQQLKPGVYRAAVGTTFSTNDSMVGIYLFANDARVRLAAGSMATVAPDTVTLVAGKVWVADIVRPAQVRVRTDLATVEVDAAVAMVERRANSVWVCSLDGPVGVRTEAGSVVRLTGSQQVEVSPRGPGPVEPVPFAGAVTGWMAQMIVLQQDSSELHARVGEMVGAFVEGTHRDAAAVELRRLGAHAVPVLFGAIDKVEASVQGRTAALLADLAEFSQCGWLFALLERPDPTLRAHGFRALQRVTGMAIEDEAFWRQAPPAERDAALLRWRARLR